MGVHAWPCWGLLNVSISQEKVCRVQGVEFRVQGSGSRIKEKLFRERGDQRGMLGWGAEAEHWFRAALKTCFRGQASGCEHHTAKPFSEIFSPPQVCYQTEPLNRNPAPYTLASTHLYHTGVSRS